MPVSMQPAVDELRRRVDGSGADPGDQRSALGAFLSGGVDSSPCRNDGSALDGKPSTLARLLSTTPLMTSRLRAEVRPYPDRTVFDRSLSTTSA